MTQGDIQYHITYTRVQIYLHNNNKKAILQTYSYEKTNKLKFILLISIERSFIYFGKILKFLKLEDTFWCTNSFFIIITDQLTCCSSSRCMIRIIDGKMSWDAWSPQAIDPKWLHGKYFIYFPSPLQVLNPHRFVEKKNT